MLRPDTHHRIHLNPLFAAATMFYWQPWDTVASQAGFQIAPKALFNRTFEGESENEAETRGYTCRER